MSGRWSSLKLVLVSNVDTTIAEGNSCRQLVPSIDSKNNESVSGQFYIYMGLSERL